MSDFRRIQKNLRDIIGYDAFVSKLTARGSKEDIGARRGISYFSSDGTVGSTGGSPSSTPLPDDAQDPSTDPDATSTDGGGGIGADGTGSGGTGGTGGTISTTKTLNANDFADDTAKEIGNAIGDITGVYDCKTGQPYDVNLTGEYSRPFDKSRCTETCVETKLDPEYTTDTFWYTYTTSGDFFEGYGASTTKAHDDLRSKMDLDTYATFVYELANGDVINYMGVKGSITFAYNPTSEQAISNVKYDPDSVARNRDGYIPQGGVGVAYSQRDCASYPSIDPCVNPENYDATVCTKYDYDCPEDAVWDSPDCYREGTGCVDPDLFEDPNYTEGVLWAAVGSGAYESGSSSCNAYGFTPEQAVANAWKHYASVEDPAYEASYKRILIGAGCRTCRQGSGWGGTKCFDSQPVFDYYNAENGRYYYKVAMRSYSDYIDDNLDGWYSTGTWPLEVFKSSYNCNSIDWSTYVPPESSNIGGSACYADLRWYCPQASQFLGNDSLYCKGDVQQCCPDSMAEDAECNWPSDGKVNLIYNRLTGQYEYDERDPDLQTHDYGEKSEIKLCNGLNEEIQLFPSADGNQIIGNAAKGVYIKVVDGKVVAGFDSTQLKYYAASSYTQIQ